MTVSRAVATMFVTAGLTTACTSSGSSDGKTSPPTSGTRPSTTSPTSCSKATAEPAKTLVITGKSVEPSCVTLKRGTGLSIVNGNRTALHGGLTAPSKKQITVDLPHKNSVYPFTTKKPGVYVFACGGCADKLQIFVS